MGTANMAWACPELEASPNPTLSLLPLHIDRFVALNPRLMQADSSAPREMLLRAPAIGHSTGTGGSEPRQARAAGSPRDFGRFGEGHLF